MLRSAFCGLLTTLLLAGCTAQNTEPAAGTPLNSVGTGSTPATTSPAALAGEWHIQTLNGAALPAKAAEASLNFNTATNKVSGSTGCNRLTGTYTVSGTGITFGPLVTTRMACPPKSPEASLLAVLGSKTLTYQLTNNSFTLLEGTTTVVTLSR